MINLTTALLISIGFIIYYTIFQVFSDFIRAGMFHNTPNKLISELRTEYQVNIRTFQKNNSLLGFAWFKSIWLNENLFRNKNKLIYTFHHEYYHLQHRHKAKVLMMRFAFSLLPLLLVIIKWYFFIPIFLSCAVGVMKVGEYFEVLAHDYARKLTYNESTTTKKGTKSNQ